jgi:hypothetical protein
MIKATKNGNNILWCIYTCESLPLAVAVLGPVFPVPTSATAQQAVSREHSQLPSDTNVQELRIKPGTLHTKQRTNRNKTISRPTKNSR